MLNKHNAKYVAALAKALQADQDEVVDCIITDFHARHRQAERNGDDRILLPFARGEDKKMLTGEDLYVYLGSVHLHDQAELERRIGPRAQERIEELEQLVAFQQRRIEILRMMQLKKCSEQEAAAIVDEADGLLADERAARLAAAPSPKLPEGTGCKAEGEP